MRIGLIAMSGMRACDAELLRLGLTLPGFVERSKVDRLAAEPRAAHARRHDAATRRRSRYTKSPTSASWTQLPASFDLVAISSFSAQIKEAYALADALPRAGRRASSSAACTSPRVPRRSRRALPTPSSSAKARSSGRSVLHDLPTGGRCDRV